jgi:hypothetical protein
MPKLKSRAGIMAGCCSVDEAAWASLYSTASRPFDPPETGKIAIKVINHYGDEALEVFSCQIS